MMNLKAIIFFSIILALFPLGIFGETVAESSASAKTSAFLAGKTAVINGGTGGIGRTISMELARAGANVVFITHNPTAAKQLIKDMQDKYGVKGGYVECLITDEKQVASMVKYVVDNFGSLDIAINRAGAEPTDKSYAAKPVSELTEQDWDAFIDNSLKGYFFSTKQELLQMKKQGKGIIINAALEGFSDRKANISLYYTAKAGVEALTKTAALENWDSGVRLNMVYADGAIPSEENVGRAIAWLCADAGANITGESINLNVTK